MPTITALVHIVPDDDPFGTPTDTRIYTGHGAASIELDGPGFALVFRDLAHLDAWLTGVRHDLDELTARASEGDAA